MERPVKGDIVVLPFPFSDLSSSKRRPALVLASLEGEDCILAQMTSTERKNNYTLSLKDQECKEGVLENRVIFVQIKFLQQIRFLLNIELLQSQKRRKKK